MAVINLTLGEKDSQKINRSLSPWLFNCALKGEISYQIPRPYSKTLAQFHAGKKPQPTHIRQGNTIIKKQGLVKLDFEFMLRGPLNGLSLI